MACTSVHACQSCPRSTSAYSLPGYDWKLCLPSSHSYWPQLGSRVALLCTEICAVSSTRCMRMYTVVQKAEPLSVVHFIDKNENSEQKDKQNTLLSNCTNTANTYKSTISQDSSFFGEVSSNGCRPPVTARVSWWSAMIGGCQAKFKLTQEKQRKWQFQSQTDKIKYKSETVSVIFDTKIAIQSLLTNKTLAFEKFIRKEYQLRFCPCQPELTHRNWWNAFLSLEEITHYSVNRKNVWPFNTGIYNRKCKIMSEKS